MRVATSREAKRGNLGRAVCGLQQLAVTIGALCFGLRLNDFDFAVFLLFPRFGRVIQSRKGR